MCARESVRVCVHACFCGCFVHASVCLRVRDCVCGGVWLCVRALSCMSACVRVCGRACIHLRTCVCAHARTRVLALSRAYFLVLVILCVRSCVHACVLHVFVRVCVPT